MPRSLAARMRTYQAERFPVAAYLPLLAVAVFAALAFSRAAGDAAGPFPVGALVLGTGTCLAFFLLLRVLDEHKDAATDARYRPELPVPRGLVSLAELRAVGAGVVAAVVIANGAVSPRLLAPVAAVLVWAALMGREFFARDWLRARPLAYLLSHMVVMPLVLLYATSLDWLLRDGRPPDGLAAFLALAFANGLVLEIGRKLRAPAEEREGVETYTAAWGSGRAVAAWLGALAGAVVAGWLAGRAAGVGTAVALVLVPLALLAAAPAAVLLARPAAGAGKRLETVSGLWLLASYAAVGALAAWGGGGGA